ncbi:MULTISPECIES: hypothetical protein [unclassified Egicoccus]|uniref:hypothetical protein n=1 Tax=unclassified Egicoccus TaxID=2635606 RepID=UPI00359ED205
MSDQTIEVVGLDIIARPGEALDEKVRRAGQAKALTTFAKEIEDAAREDLQAEVEQVAALTGTGFSAKVDGIRATLTDPQPRPRIADQDAFDAWWAAQGLEHEVRETLDIDNHAFRWIMAMREQFAADAPESGADYAIPADEFHNLIFGAITPSLERVLPAKPLDHLIESGRAVIRGNRDDGYVLLDPSTGEAIPGVDVDPPSKPVLQVVPDKQAKARDAAIVRSFFGLSVEIGGGL